MCIAYLSRDSCHNLICKNLDLDSSVRKLFSQSKFAEEIFTPQTEQNFYLRAQVILLLRVAERFM